jgi:hypothetical protein
MVITAAMDDVRKLAEHAMRKVAEATGDTEIE